MEAYRDQYATLFNNGKGVAVIGISTDDDTVQFNWARDAHFPVYFASDPDAAVGKRYDVMNPFKEMVGDSYTELGAAVTKAGKP